MAKQTIFVLTGALAGATKLLGGKYQFDKGQMAYIGGDADFEKLSRYLERCYQAYPSDHVKAQEVLNGQHKVHPERNDAKRSTEVERGAESHEQVPPKETANEGVGNDNAEAGSTGDAGSSGDGQASTDPEMTRLKDALMRLDPENDDHWTKSGEPAIEAVSALAGLPTLVRKQIKAAYPGFDREKATALKIAA